MLLKAPRFLIEAIQKIQKWKGIYWDGFTPNNDCQFWKPFPIFILFLRIWKMCRYKMNGHMHDGMQCERNLEKIISFYLWKHGLQFNVWIMHVKWCALLIINACNHEDDACGMMCSYPLSVYSIMINAYSHEDERLKKFLSNLTNLFFRFPRVILSQFLLAQHEISSYFGFFFLLIFFDFSFNHQQKHL